MIIKVCQFQAQHNGERLIQVFQPGQMESLQKTAAPLQPDVQRYLEKLKPDARKIYVLVNALGAGEFWGSNINGDWFPENALIHEGMDYGYKTFLNSHCFAHHVNKDPAKSFGDVEKSVWHPDMKRVELSMVGSGTEQSCQLSDLGQNPECHGSDLDQSGNVTGRI